MSEHVWFEASFISSEIVVFLAQMHCGIVVENKRLIETQRK